MLFGIKLKSRIDKVAFSEVIFVPHAGPLDRLCSVISEYGGNSGVKHRVLDFVWDMILDKVNLYKKESTSKIMEPGCWCIASKI